MVEVLLSGIVLGLVPVTILGLFVAAFLQYRRGNKFEA
jgi:cytochrome b6-f complex subunit 5